MNERTPSEAIASKSGGTFDCLYDDYFTLIETDESIYHFLGHTRESFQKAFHGRMMDAIYPEDRELIRREIREQLSTGNVFMYENRLVGKNGELYWVWVSAEARSDPERGSWFHCTFHDITEEKQNQEQLAVSEQRYEIVLSQMQDIIFELDCQTFEIYYSPNFEKKFGYSIPPEGFPDSMFATDIIYEDDKALLRKKFQDILQGAKSMQHEYRIKKSDGSYLWVEVHATAIREPYGGLRKILGIITDINSRKQEIIEVRRTAVLDPLTGLLNRRECIKRIEEYIQQSEAMAAFMLIDVDNFKTINDTMGHAYGDCVLTELAAGMRALFRQSDIVARLGGDEFVVFMSNIQERENAITKLNGILNLFKQYKHSIETNGISCSIGCSIYPEHGTTFSSLFQKADAAMYHAKKRGKSQYYIYEEGKVPGIGENGEILPARNMQKNFHDHIIETVCRFFLEHPEHDAIPLLLGQLSSIFHADRISIFEKTGGMPLCRYCFQAPSALPQQAPQGQSRYPESWEEVEDEPAIIYGDTAKIEDAAVHAWFSGRGAKAAAAFLLKNKENIRTLILYEDCQKTRQHSEEELYTLSMVSEIIHLFLEKERGSHKILEQNEHEAAHKELVYRTALKETHINVWEYDVKAHTLLLTESAEEHHAFTGRLENVPQSLLDNGYVHPGSRQDLVHMYQELDRGAPHAQADILTLSRDHKNWWWERIRYTMIYDEDGRPRHAVAIGEDITKQKEAELQYLQDLQLRMAFNDNLLASFRCNLTTNFTEYVEGKLIPNIPPGMAYEELMELHNRYVATQEDALRIEKLMSREALVQAFSQGNTMLAFEYRRSDGSGRLSWVCATVRLIQDTQNGSLYAYGVLQDITEKKNLELAIKDRAEHDMLTGTYNKDTAIQIITDALKKAHRQKGSYALLVFNVDQFTQIVHNSGYLAADSILKELASQLMMRFSKEKIIGRFYGDEFLVYVYDNPKPDLVRRYAEEVRKAISMPYLFPNAKQPVSVCAGIVFDNSPQTTFDTLYRKARLALIAAKASGRNNCQIYSEQLEQFQCQTASGALALHEPVAIRHSGSGEGILLKCMYSLTSSIDFRDSLENALKELGSYYNGDRVYVIELEQKEQEVRSIYEWKKEDVISIRDTGSILLTPDKISGQMHNQLRQLRYRGNIEELQKSQPAIYQPLKKLGIHSYFLATLDEKNFSVGYIGIDNPRRNTDDITVINTLRYVLANELTKRRLQDKQHFLSYHDGLTGVLNRNSYKEYCESLSEEGLISLGIVSLDINGLKEINRAHGNAHGDEVVRSVARALEEEFPFSRVYRFTGDEFLVVCENISHDSFHLRLRKLKERSRDICSISIGSAWSDADIHLDSLTHNADEQRMIAKQSYYDGHATDSRRWNGGTRRELMDKLQKDLFCIYLQPKIDARDNRIYGAEALVRYQDPEEGLIMPMKFIPSLENAGLIHYIDFFVLNQVCRTLKEWEENGLPLIPVSLNFSRSTLLVDDLIARMDDIVARHGTDRKYIEIEITESLGDVERSTIARIGNQIRRAGYRIALDDFGAKYSNISFLSALQFHHLKLDKGLVNNLITNENARLIVKNIMNLCRELGIRVIAEGVENEEQMEILKKLQCCYIQGYYYDKPIPVKRFVERYLD